MRSENRAAVVLPLSNGYHQFENCAGDIARALVPKLHEFDSLWELTNSICDRYLEPAAA